MQTSSKPRKLSGLAGFLLSSIVQPHLFTYGTWWRYKLRYISSIGVYTVMPLSDTAIKNAKPKPISLTKLPTKKACTYLYTPMVANISELITALLVNVRPMHQVQRPSLYRHEVGNRIKVYEATSGFTCVTAYIFADWNSRPLITQTPLLLTIKGYGQLL
jgi:hypothetical protein